MSKVKKIKISQFGTTITGKTPSSTFPEDFGCEYMFVTPSDYSNNKFICKSERFLSKAGKEKLSSKLLPKKSILVTCIGSAMGKVALNKFDCVTNQQINSIVVNQDYDPDYLYYSFKNNYELLRNASSGSTAVPILNKTDFDNLEISIHENIKDQQKIASILSSLDSKIELNGKINSDLDQFAKTLYDYWFMQFDFPDKKGRPYKTSGGKMVWNEELKREIPEGWAIKKMSEWIDLDKNGDWGKEELQDNYNLKVTCIRGTDLDSLNGLEISNPPVRFILRKNTHKILNPSDIIIEISGGSPTQSTGRMAYITEATLKRFDNPLICSNFCKAISLKNKKLVYNFASYWNSLYENGTFFGYEGKTSGIKNLLFDSFVNSYLTVMPEQSVVDMFYSLMEDLQKKKQNALLENKELTDLRDWLLPMLMNGQVKVK